MSTEPQPTSDADHGPSEPSGRSSVAHLNADERIIDVEMKPSAVLGTWLAAIRIIGELGLAAACAVILMGTIWKLAEPIRKLADMLGPSQHEHPAIHILITILIICSALALPIGVLLYYVAGDVRRWRRAGGDTHSDQSLRQLATSLIQNPWAAALSARLRRLLGELVATGCGNVLVRGSLPGRLPWDEPFDTPFEPLPAAANDAVQQLLESGPEERNAARDAAALRRRTRRNIIIAVITGILVLITLHTLVTGELNLPCALPVIALIILIVLGGMSAQPESTPRQWFLVPGGVLVRGTWLFSTKWEVHVFDRRTAAMIVIQVATDKWLVLVGDAEGHTQGHFSSLQIEGIIRAWRAPFEPPPADQLSDLV